MTSVAFDNWVQVLTPALRDVLNPVTLEPGAYPGRGHYRRAAEETLRILRDLPAAQAAYLHGLNTDQFEGLPKELVSDEVRIAWRSRLLLRERGADGPSGRASPNGAEAAAEQRLGPREDAKPREHSRLIDPLRSGPFRGSGLPLVSGEGAEEGLVRAAVGLIAEQLDHWDSTGAWRQWSRAYHTRPSPLDELPEAVVRGMVHRGGLALLDELVAPLADAVGLWYHCAAAHNLARAAVQPTRMRRLARELSAPEVSAAAETVRAAAEKALRRCLPRDWAVPRVEWRWRHLASVLDLQAQDRADDEDEVSLNPGTPSAVAARRLDRAGAVVVQVPSGPNADTRAWTILGHLHQAFRPWHGSLEDRLSHQDVGYRALHTEVEVSKQHPRISIRVRVSPGSSQLSLATVARRLGPLTTPQIAVYTPKGDIVRLPKGATVLDFAVEVHPELGALCKGARVDRREVGPFQVLTDGSHVLVHKADRPVPLPPDWRDRVAPGRGAELMRRMKPFYEDVSVADGRKAVRDHLKLVAQVQDDVSDDTIDQALVQALRSLGWEGGIGTRRWLRRLAQHTQLASAGDAIDAATRERILEAVGRALQEAGVVVPLVELPPAYANHHPTYCDHCADHTWLSTFWGTAQDDRLVLHAAENCRSAVGTRIEVPNRRTRRIRQWVVMESAGRDGITGDLMIIYRDLPVHIEEVVARHTATRQGLFRVEIGPLDEETEEALLGGLRAVNGVQAAYIVREDERERLSPELPPPRYRVTRALGLTYTVGPPVWSDECFYGREAEINQLLHYLGRGADPTGASIFLSGPLRAGKTSIALRARYLLQALDPRAVVAHLEAQPPMDVHVGEVWSSYRVRLRNRLAEALRAAVPTVGPLPEDLVAVVAAAYRGGASQVLLMIDEAVGLLACTEADGAPAWNEMVRDFDEIRAQGGRIVFIGPPATVSVRGEWTTGHVSWLGRLTQVTVRGFERVEDVISLLTMSAGSPHPPRRLSRNEARRLLDLTGGEPCWLQAIGEEAERLASTQPVLVLDYDLLTKAVEAVLNRPSLFHPRTARDGQAYVWIGGHPGTRVWSVLLTMAEVYRRQPELPVSQTVLSERTGLTLDLVGQVMGGLTQMGAVRPSKDSAHAWHFVGSILALYLLRHLPTA